MKSLFVILSDSFYFKQRGLTEIPTSVFAHINNNVAIAMSDTVTEVVEDNFMKTFKALKRKSPPADLGSVINVDDSKWTSMDKVKQIYPQTVTSTEHEGMIPSSEWSMYELTSVPGAILIRNPFRDKLRKYMIARCYSMYPRLPNVTNHIDSKMSYEDVWQDFCSDAPSDMSVDYIKKLRWVTLGYHYDWTKKIYVKENKSEFPQDLSQLTQFIVHAVLGEEIKFKAEASIVNYYHADSTLSGHTDHSEFDLTAPLISISFGRTCVFMIGGQSKAQVPEALFLRDGDVFIMSRNARMSYHAVPRILPNDSSYLNYTPAFPGDVHTSNIPTDRENCHLKRTYDEKATPCKRIKLESEKFSADLISSLEDADSWSLFRRLLSGGRLNINVRQVFEPGKGPEDYIWPEKDNYIAI
ncbi:nucleic acid dioxygenase ALKBH1-like isoform X1 [Watersipora subatra]|uniref:nucleic acid dioxygenase ALKBH1-like isoform X1 n=1 Tax=Watersipora subatra TaxID=2589382 RepID=UPI00355C929C